MPFYKAVILIAGAQKGTRFRPLSLDIPKPLFPVAGAPIVQHHIEALAKVQGVCEVLLLGFYPSGEMAEFVRDMNAIHPNLSIRYLQEYAPLGTAGGLYHFRDQIRSGQPDAFFVINGDVCADFPLQDLVDFHLKEGGPVVTLLATEATRQQSLNYGCVVEEDALHHTLGHYVEKPNTYISSLINCGVYVCSLEIFKSLASAFEVKQTLTFDRIEVMSGEKETMYLEQDILPALAGTGEAKVFQTTNWWSPVKTAASAIYANRHYLALYQRRCPDRLFKGPAVENGNNGIVKEDSGPPGSGLRSAECPKVVGNVIIHPSAVVHPTAVLGPNVSVGAYVRIGQGVRVKESIVLEGSVVGDNCMVMFAIIGKAARIGAWTRIEGTPNDPNPDKPFTKMDNNALFSSEGKLNPSITIVGCNVIVPSEVILLNSIVLPHKQLSGSIKNEIVL